MGEESSKKTTFQTPFGRYRFLRMPYGIKTAPEVFHRIYSDLFRGIPNVAVYIDDILVWAESKNELNSILKTVFDKARENGVKVNPKKCEFGVNCTKFLGHVLSDKGILADPSKVQAVLAMEKPKDVQALERFIGMTTYLAKFMKI
ncbi:MAG: RNA-directed DNA polymerase [Acinetobacter sp.]|nr:RNA-directed DNA polymerase [Acinetobacter sp.]